MIEEQKYTATAQEMSDAAKTLAEAATGIHTHKEALDVIASQFGITPDKLESMRTQCKSLEAQGLPPQMAANMAVYDHMTPEMRQSPVGQAILLGVQAGNFEPVNPEDVQALKAILEDSGVSDIKVSLVRIDGETGEAQHVAGAPLPEGYTADEVNAKRAASEPFFDKLREMLREKIKDARKQAEHAVRPATVEEVVAFRAGQRHFRPLDVVTWRKGFALNNDALPSDGEFVVTEVTEAGFTQLKGSPTVERLDTIVAIVLGCTDPACDGDHLYEVAIDSRRLQLVRRDADH